MTAVTSTSTSDLASTVVELRRDLGTVPPCC
jgi:hypothetical protein